MKTSNIILVCVASTAFSLPFHDEVYKRSDAQEAANSRSRMMMPGMGMGGMGMGGMGMGGMGMGGMGMGGMGMGGMAMQPRVIAQPVPVIEPTVVQPVAQPVAHGNVEYSNHGSTPTQVVAAPPSPPSPQYVNTVQKTDYGYQQNDAPKQVIEVVAKPAPQQVTYSKSDSDDDSY